MNVDGRNELIIVIVVFLSMMMVKLTQSSFSAQEPEPNITKVVCQMMIIWMIQK